MGETDFDWANLPADLVRAFARALDGGRPDDARAMALLRERMPEPTSDFFREWDVRVVVANAWLPSDPVATDELYAALNGGPIATARKGVELTSRRKLSAVRKVANPPEGKRQSEPVRRELAEALRRAGGALQTAGASGEHLRSLNVVSTRDGVVPRLHPHQQRVVDTLRAEYREHGNRLVGVVVMPTGAGKTMTAAQWLLGDAVACGVKVLWVTHRQELLRQTAETFVRCAAVVRETHERLQIRLIGAGYASATTLGDTAPDVVIATVGALARQKAAVRHFLASESCVVVFDEAHHAVARTWREILWMAREETDDAVLGLTATPTRMGEDERRLLGRLFERTLAQVRLGELTAGGFLAEARVQSVRTDVDAEALADVDDLEHLRHYGELSAGFGRRLAANVPRNRTIVNTYTRGPADGLDDGYGQTIVFAVDVDHAHVLARDFAAAGVPSGALTASVSTFYAPEREPLDTARDELLDRFRKGRVHVLVNVQVMTEGVDVPSVKTAFLARPTGSQVLMSQMVGRALRGERVGGTAHAYLVTFRDHWDRFPDWADPISLPGIAAEPVEPTTDQSESAPREGTIEIEKWRRLLFAAADEVLDRVPATAAAPWNAVPVGLFAFEVELPVEDSSEEGEELEAHHVDLFVHAHEQTGFEALRAAVEAGDTAHDAEEWLARFFAETPVPLPPLSRLDLLARYLGTEERLPTYVPLTDRDVVDPRRIAQRIFDADAKRDEREAMITAAYGTNPALVDAFYGGADGLRRSVLDEFTRLEKGDPQPFDETRVPRVRGADRVEHRFGLGAHDLGAILDRVRTDPTLFSPPLRAPKSEIEWTKRAIGSVWGDYTSDIERIRVNVLLDSPEVDARIVEFLVYHELLHHQDYVLGHKHNPRNGLVDSPHDRDFREREARHPAMVDANAWMDSFEERLVAIDERGMPVQR